MGPTVGDTTSPTLLRRGGNWQDHLAWLELVARYEPMLRHWCLPLRLDAASIEEVIQRIWIDLARRLPSFQYDPSRSFRGWLNHLCRSRALDVLRDQGRDEEVSLEECEEVPGATDALTSGASGPSDDSDRGGSAERLVLLRVMAAEAQRVVRSKVDPDTWRAYWLIVIEDRTVKEAAESLQKTKAATFAAQKRVKERLRIEGKRLLAEHFDALSGEAAGSLGPFS